MGIQTTFAGIPICLSLKTHAFSVAAELARRLSTLSDQVFLYATTMSLSSENTRDLLTTLARFEIEAADRERALGDPRSPQLAQAALEREAARQAVLRQAFFQRDYAVAQEPLKHVAAHLGIQLPEAGCEQAQLLAYEATRVLLDNCEEKARRDKGIFPGPSPYFARAIAEETSPGVPAQPTASAIAEPPIDKEEAMKLFPRNWFASRQPGPVPPAMSEEAPVSSERPEKKDIRELLRSRGVLKSCSPEILAILEKRGAMTVHEGFMVYQAFKGAGFGEEWQRHQKPDEGVGERWKKSSLPALRTAGKIWGEEFGSTGWVHATEEDIEEAIKLIRSLPKFHGKGNKYTAASYRALITKVKAREAAAMDAAEREARRKGCTNETEIRDLRLAEAEPRIRVATYLRLVRSANRVGTMLKKLGIVETNPFDICTFTTREEKSLKATETTLEREPWDDRLNELLDTRVFQGNAAGEADPLFWMPLIGLLMGTRMEEAAQAGPGDVQSDEGIAYLIVRQALGDSVKSENATRKIPLHPVLIELGFLEFVKRAKKRGDRRLFPSLTRGANKGTYTENFTKAFGYYRRTNDVYWHGLDFHALRTTFHHRLSDASCPGAHRRKLMGHEPLDEGERAYSQKGISIASLFEQVKKIPFDVSRVQTPISGFPERPQEAQGLRLVQGSKS
ncbi:site-specific integrase [Sagittula salina]|uniref:Site-specific integrase n=1 Tax=Sagittula salina TaxID=2820268 RepID=A0A940MP22_9RHOB|nr:site-specific integrase [Sagittula salina]MBP0482093.1 site-specific integrase [Sagittula salina]